MIKIRPDDKIKMLNDILVSELEDFLDPHKLQKFIVFSANFDTLSLKNCLLLFNSNKIATQVATFKQWKDLNCSIKKGSKGIQQIYLNNGKLSIYNVFDKSQVVGNIPEKRKFQTDTYNHLISISTDECIEKYNLDENKDFKLFSDAMSLTFARVKSNIGEPTGYFDYKFETATNLRDVLTLSFNISKNTFNKMHKLHLEENYYDSNKKFRNPSINILKNDITKQSTNDRGTRRTEPTRLNRRTRLRPSHRKLWLSLDKLHTNREDGITQGINDQTIYPAENGKTNKRENSNIEREFRSSNTDKPISKLRTNERYNRKSKAEKSNIKPSRGTSNKSDNLQLSIFDIKEEGTPSSFLLPKNELFIDDILVVGIEDTNIPLKDNFWNRVPEVKDFKTETLISPINEVPSVAVSDFRTDELIIPTTKKEKLSNNISAIKLLYTLNNENRLATKEEQATLHKYIGFGGLAEVFDETNEKYKDEYNTILNLCTKEDYKSLKSSTLSAHYTPKQVIDFMYNALDKIGFIGGNILDPSIGTGNFLAFMPEDLRKNSKITGVEIDNITGNISKNLYPNSNILVKGFEDISNSNFDVILSNIPFGDFNIANKNHNALIHDFFFLNALDKVKAGGIVAFVTSKGTLDKKNPIIRRKLSKQADLLFAVRLPNNTFKKIADTNVTTDILFLQKRSDLNLEEPSWVYNGKTILNNGDEAIINQYFVDNPHMILGNLTKVPTQYGKDDFAVRSNELSLDINLKNALTYVTGEFNIVSEPVSNEPEIADDSINNFCFGIKDSRAYYRENDILNAIPRLHRDTIQLYLNLKESLKGIINCQLDGTYTKDSHIVLNACYDDFVKSSGYINERKNSRLLSVDIDYYLVSSIENRNKDGTYSKGDIFTKRTINQKQIITSADTAIDALNICLAKKGQVDLDYITSIYPCDDIVSNLKGEIFIDPLSVESTLTYISKDEYLSGYVLEKMQLAKSLVCDFPILAENITALDKCKPKFIKANDIAIRLSTHWIDERYINQFLQETFEFDGSANVKATYSKIENLWRISNKSAIRTVNNTKKFGTNRVIGLQLTERTLNQKKITIMDKVSDGDKDRLVYNHKESVFARSKQTLLESEFKNWIFKDIDRRTDLENYYNSKFNGIVSRTYDGSHLLLDYLTDDVKLRTHQLNAVSRVSIGKNTLLAHVVGAGKTYTMVAGGLEQLRLGNATKIMYVVPNHLIEQFGSDFLKLCPTANILVTSKKDFEPANRKRFISKIATSDIDAVILGHSQFEKINISLERRKRELELELDGLEHAITSLSSDADDKTTVKRLESRKKSLETKMKEILSDSSKDKGICFEELGIDSLFVDEAHYFKNGAIFSKMQNVAGVSSSHSLKASDMLAKCRFINEIDGSITFATGTPISNSISEMYVLQRYLQEDRLNSLGIYHFDEWASIFGETELVVELKPEGNGFQSKTRFSKYFNLPELKKIFSEVADIQTSNMLNLPTPKLYDGKSQIIVSEPSLDLKIFMGDTVTRAEKIRDGLVEPYEDNMLKLTSDARKAGTDMRLYDPEAEFNPNGKLSKCAELIYKHYTESDGTQLVFSDIGTPSSKFNVYDELKRICILNGILEDDICFIHDAKNELQREELFDDMRQGNKRILIGSTQKCGAGTNIQDKLIALHHIDCPWRPSDIEQREGRILRQGNSNEEVSIYRYITKQSFDAYSWQTVENKQKFISQIMNVNSDERSCGDVDEAILSFAEVKAIATGNPLIKEKMEIENEINRLTILDNLFKKELHEGENLYSKILPESLAKLEISLQNIKIDLDIPKQNNFAITLDNITFDERSKSSEKLHQLMSKHFLGKGTATLGEFNSLKLNYTFDNVYGNYSFSLVGNYCYVCNAGTSSMGNITRIENLFDSIANTFEENKSSIVTTKDKISSLSKLLEQKDFPEMDKLNEFRTKLINITAELDSQNNIQKQRKIDDIQLE